jgi:hypothetical protein
MPERTMPLKRAALSTLLIYSACAGSIGVARIVGQLSGEDQRLTYFCQDNDGLMHCNIKTHELGIMPKNVVRFPEQFITGGRIGDIAYPHQDIKYTGMLEFEDRKFKYSPIPDDGMIYLQPFDNKCIELDYEIPIDEAQTSAIVDLVLKNLPQNFMLNPNQLIPDSQLSIAQRFCENAQKEKFITTTYTVDFQDQSNPDQRISVSYYNSPNSIRGNQASGQITISETNSQRIAASTQGQEITKSEFDQIEDNILSILQLN